MKFKIISYSILSFLLCVACSDEENVVPRKAEFVPRFEFPQGANEWDRTAEDIRDKFGVYMIYKDMDTLDLRRTWTSSGSYYVGKDLTGYQAERHFRFMKDHVFAYLTPELTKNGLPLYYYLVYNYRSTPTSKDMIISNSSGIDFWVNSIFNSDAETISTPEQYFERRYRTMRTIIESLCRRGNLVALKDFHAGFDYVTPLITYLPADLNYTLKRGFPGLANGDNMFININSIYNINSITPLSNFIAYINLGMRYSPEELETAYPKELYPKIHQNRDYIVKYMKEAYGLDLEAIYRGPEL